MTENDKTPQGKRADLSLREKEKQITKDSVHGVDTSKAKTTLDDIFNKHMSLLKLKQSTRTNYTYMYQKYVAPKYGKMSITAIKKSDIQHFYKSLIEVQNFKLNSMEIIHTILHPVFQLAVDDDTQKQQRKRKKRYLPTLTTRLKFHNRSEQSGLYFFTVRFVNYKHLYKLCFV